LGKLNFCIKTPSNSHKIIIMRLIKFLSLTALLALAGTGSIRAQDEDSTGLPGDNFSLQGALDLFKKAESPEDFEKLVNTESNNVNNLDLNGDGEIDYVRVVARKEKDAHVFILQVPVSASENQDIAVIEIEKTGDEQAVLQIVGDEDIYGEETIVEASDGTEEEAPVAFSAPSHGPNTMHIDQSNAIVNVWFWPSVRFIYRPAYTVWVSPWRWRHHPVWFRPWRPYSWHAYRPLRVRYYAGCRVVRTHRVVYAHNVYRPIRVSAVSVRTRNAHAVNNYRVTRTRTSVTGARGNSHTRTTTTVKNGRGQVKYKKTKVKKGRRG
jgi:hypothetical protein